MSSPGQLWPPDPPLRSGAPYWYWLGGRPALDFVNTRRERWRRNVECLVDGDDLVDWLVQARLLGAPAPGVSPPALLAAARALREGIDAGVRAAVAGRPPESAALGAIDAWLEHLPRPRLRADGSFHERPPASTPREALALVALDAAAMLGTAERDRVRICASATCSARFYDRSPAARRRWCSMTGCGNNEKARRHRARQRAVPSHVPLLNPTQETVVNERGPVRP